ncbi:hypothetical protein M153_500003141 [Pseudoloma neurophilia]|uniref:Tc1-like transposase DDE domain-containing protein n=1 Tax=Pseudoloma neurophilia TaxID=146866 RepID=A0A0R0M0D4_9MICR|nr:hypothetical protein M153_500003141 [Pseudoloma neurophilia]
MIDGKILFLPPYSPFLNIIENCFSKWKNQVKRSNSNTVQELLTAINTELNCITQSDLQGYYRKMISYLPRCRNGEEILE